MFHLLVAGNDLRLISVSSAYQPSFLFSPLTFPSATLKNFTAIAVRLETQANRLEGYQNYHATVDIMLG